MKVSTEAGHVDIRRSDDDGLIVVEVASYYDGGRGDGATAALRMSEEDVRKLIDVLTQIAEGLA